MYWTENVSENVCYFFCAGYTECYRLVSYDINVTVVVSVVLARSLSITRDGLKKQCYTEI